jgi:hypothetical protein
MGIFVPKSVGIYYDEFKWPNIATTVKLTHGQDMKDITSLSDVGRIFGMGLSKADLNISGYIDYANTGMDTIINLDLAAGTKDQAISIVPNVAANSPAYCFYGIPAKYSTNIKIGDLLGFDMDASLSSNALVRCNTLDGEVTYTGPATGTVIVDLGAAALTGKTIYAFFHCTNKSTTGAFVLNLNSSANSDMSSPSSGAISFSNTGANGEIKTLAGNAATAKRYWRISCTLASGTATAIVSIGVI